MQIQESKAELLLTSAGPTTEAIQERLLGMSRSLGRISRLKVVRVADGWAPFKRGDQVSVKDRVTQRAEAWGARWWSDKYLSHVLTGADVRTREFGDTNPKEVEDLIARADLLVVPGGNTYQTLRSLKPYKIGIQKRVYSGELPYFGESDGAILAGQTIRSAALPPADINPHVPNLGEDGLGLTPSDVVVHAQLFGRPKFGLPRSKIANWVLDSASTGWEYITPFIASEGQENIPVVVLNDFLALSVHGPREEVI